MKENAIFNSKDELVKMFIDNTPIAYIILDKDYRIHYINKSFAKLRNLDRSKTIGDKCYNISNGGVRCQNCAIAQSLATGEKAFVSRKDVMTDGSVRFIDDYAVPLQVNRHGQVEYVLEIMINRTPEMLAREQRNKDYDEILTILTNLLEIKDTYTAAHSDNVRRLSLNLAHAMNLTPDQIFEITVAASLHDIGKVDIPISIINKPGKLTCEEFDLIKTHPVISHQMLDRLSSFKAIKDIVLHHHERVDGLGYPDGLSGERLSLAAKIVAVADTYDAITTTRSYRQALTHEYALSEIRRVAGSQLDETVVKAFVDMDFSRLTDDLYLLPDQKKSQQLERVLVDQSHTETFLEAPDELDSHIDQDKLLSEIFNNTPCGYILMDKNRMVHYASDFFLRYMGLRKEDVLNKRCYEAGGIGSKPCENCSIERALLSGKTEYMRQEQFTNNGKKIFDLYGVPLTEGDKTVEYVIEIIIDRTEEVQMERARQRDFESLIEVLGEIFDKQKDQLDVELLSGQIVRLRTRLNELLQNCKSL